MVPYPPSLPDAYRLDRRHFLGVAGLAALGSASALAAGPAKPEFTFALASDTHLGRTASEIKQMPPLMDEINQSGAALTLFCGDLVDNGQVPDNEARYSAWKDLARGLKKDWYAIPGNHDPDELFRKHIQPQTDFVVERGSIRFLCFRNAQPNPGHDGVVTPEQHRWLRDRIEEAEKKGQRVILVAHVTNHANKHPDRGWYVKEGREEMIKLLQTHPSVVAFLSGHFHCGLRGWDDTHGVQEVVLPAASYNRDRRLGEAPGYCLSEFRPGHVQADVFADRLVLRYKPLGAEVMAARELVFRKD